MRKIIEKINQNMTTINNQTNKDFQSQTVVVTLLGEYFFQQKWFSFCLDSWNLLKSYYPIYVISDGSLTIETKEKLQSLGLNIVPENYLNEIIEQTLNHHSALIYLRQKSNLFKKIIDTSLFFTNKKILYIDSDVLIRKKFILPQNAPSFLFCIDDVLGYGGHWQIPLKYPIVTGLNSGFVYYDPQTINFNYINNIAEHYLLQSKNIWWLEQTCWALLAGKIDNKGIFEGREACIISGLNKRNIKDIKNNKTTYFFRSNRPIKNLETIDSLIGEAAIIHFAGPGKPWIEPIYNKMSFDSEEDVCELQWRRIENANWKEKLFLSLRMAIKG